MLTNPELKSKLETFKWRPPKAHRARQEIVYIQDSCFFFFYRFVHHQNFTVPSVTEHHSETGHQYTGGKLWESLWLSQASDRTQSIHSSYTYIYLCTQSINKTTNWKPKDYTSIHLTPKTCKRHNQPGRGLRLQIRREKQTNNQASAHFGVVDV